jgi:glycosyltransferase involved in cell wall biosynthesis
VELQKFLSEKLREMPMPETVRSFLNVLARMIRFVLRIVRKSIRILRKSFRLARNYTYVQRNFGLSGTRTLNHKYLYTWHNSRVRDIIANQASFGKFDADELFQEIKKRIEDPIPHNSNNDFQPVLLLELARLAALEPLNEVDFEQAYNTYRYAFGRYKNWHWLPSTRVHPSHDFVYLYLCTATNRIQEWRSFVDTSKLSRLAEQVAKIDKYNQVIAGNSFDKNTWVENFNEIFTAYDLEPVTFGEAPDLSEINFLDLIECFPQNQIDGKLVTVIVSSYNPGPELITSIRSLLNQSWKNLEILLVDDFSQDCTYVELALSMDNRIRLIRQEKNQGTYAARNAAMDEASGEFITFQDSDDWSHPRRIEEQVLPFMSNEDVKATYAKAVRLTKDLLFTGADGVPWREMNASSLMFRYSVFKDLGYFDSVRKGADSEYYYRIRSFYQEPSNSTPIKLCSEAFLSIVRLGSQSLSRSEIRTNWMHPARIHYRNAFHEWHKSCLRAGLVPYMPAVLTSRKFPCPTRFNIESNLREGDTQDIVLVTDLSSVSSHLVSVIKDALVLGYSVSVLNVLPEIGSEVLNESISDMIENSQVRRITIDEEIQCKLLIVEHLRLFQFQSPLPWGISSDRICVMSREKIVPSIDKIGSSKTQVLKRALGYDDQPIDMSKIRMNSPVDLSDATWFSDDALELDFAKDLSMKFLPIENFDLKSELELLAKDWTR